MPPQQPARQRQPRNRRARSGNDLVDSHDFPAALLRAISKIPDLTLRVLRLGHGRRAPRTTDISELREQLSILRCLFLPPDSSTEPRRSQCTAILNARGGEFAVAVLQLVSAAVRRPVTDLRARPSIGGSQSQSTGQLPLSPEAEGAAGLACSVASILVEHARSPARLPFVMKLLRMQTLQALARQLAEGEQMPQSMAAQRMVVFHTLTRAAMTLRSLAVFAADGEPGGFAAVAAALCDSCVMERYSRLLMRRLQLTSDSGTLLAGAFLECFGDLGRCALPIDDSDSQAFMRLTDALSGPCVSFTVLALGVKALCAADGGPLYGLPLEVVDALPVITVGRDMERTDGSASRETRLVEPNAIQSMMLASLFSVHAGRMDRRAAVALMLRVCRLADASASAAYTLAAAAAAPATANVGAAPGADEQVSGPSHAAARKETRAPNLLLPASDSWSINGLCLQNIWQLCEEQPGEWEALQPEWWRLVVVLLRAKVIGRGWAKLGDLIVAPLFQAGELQPLPAETPPTVAAALDAGLLPALERLVRRACGDAGDGGHETQLFALLLSGLPEATDYSWRLLGPLLSYGEPRQAAALVVTLGKVLRRGGTGRIWVLLMNFVLRVLESVLIDVLVEPALPNAGYGSDDAVVTPSAPPGLKAVLPLVMTQWLPPLVRFALNGARRTEQGGPLQRANVSTALHVLASWVPILVTAARLCADCGDVLCPSSSTLANSTDHGTGSSIGGGSGSGASLDARICGTAAWQHLLLRELDPVALTGAALREGVNARHVAPSVLALATAFPEVVRSATQAATAAAGCSTTSRCCDAGKETSAAASTLPWPPELLYDLSGRLPGSPSAQYSFPIRYVAYQVEMWAAGGGDTNTGEPQAMSYWHGTGESLLKAWASVARFLTTAPTPACSTIIPACGNPACTCLEGDSELDLRLQQCGRCGDVAYCCRECQATHWQAGHKGQCRPRASKGGGASSSGALGQTGIKVG